MARHHDKPNLSDGVFCISDVSRYSRLPISTIRSWFRGRADRQGRGQLLDSDYGVVRERYVVSFLDLVDVLVAGRFRGLGVSMASVRRAHSVLQGQLNQRHPFCLNKFCTDGKRIIIRELDQIGCEDLREVVSGQRWFKPVTEVLDQVEYDMVASELACRWKIAPGVVIDPQLSRGRPVVEGTGVTTFVLSNALKANGGDTGLVSGLFGVPPETVRNAASFEASIRHAA